MRRPLATILAALAMVTQVTLTMTAPLGLVFCIGETHAAVELAADDCCASHGTVVPMSEPAIERSCCSDIPLYAAVRPIVDGPRSSSTVGSAALVALPVSLAPPALGFGSARAADATPPRARAASRSAVLRV
jgi:hypothetical protein